MASGQPTLDACLMAVDEVNSNGGILVNGERRPIRLFVEDSGGVPEVAVSKAMGLISRHRVVAILGPTISRDAIAVSKVAEERQVPMLATMATHPEVTADKRYAFRMIFTDALQAQLLAEITFNDFGLRRTALVIEAGRVYSLNFGRLFTQAYTRLGGEIVAEVSVISEQEQYDSQAIELFAADPEAILLPITPNLLEPLFVAIGHADLRSKILGTDAWGAGDFPPDPSRLDSHYTDVWLPTMTDSASVNFVESYQKRYGLTANNAAALAYDATRLLARVIEEKGADPESIRQGLATTENFHGVAGTVRFSGHGDPWRSTVLIRVDKDGQRHIVKRLEPRKEAEPGS